MSEQKSDIGPNQEPAYFDYCPLCGARGKSRERTPDGCDECEHDHRYPSRMRVDSPAKSLAGRGLNLNDMKQC